MKGKLIVIEGSDGAGKATQLSLLMSYCQSHNIPCRQFDFPQYDTFFGKLCGQYLNGDFGTDVSPYLVTLPYAADRFKMKGQIEESLQEGKIVFINRYAPSNAVYHGARLSPEERTKFIAWEFELEYGQFGIPKEDVVVYLHVPVAISQGLIDQKAQRSYLTQEKKKDIHENNITLLQKTEQIYSEFCSQFSHWICIECSVKDTILPKEDIHQKIVDGLQKRGIMV